MYEYIECVLHTRIPFEIDRDTDVCLSDNNHTVARSFQIFSTNNLTNTNTELKLLRLACLFFQIKFRKKHLFQPK
jgi:hypothetical protein